MPARRDTAARLHELRLARRALLADRDALGTAEFTAELEREADSFAAMQGTTCVRADAIADVQVCGWIPCVLEALERCSRRVVLCEGSFRCPARAAASPRRGARTDSREGSTLHTKDLQ